MLRRQFFTAALLAALALLGTAATSQAGFKITVSDGSTTQAFDLQNASTLATYFNVTTVGGITRYKFKDEVVIGDYVIDATFVRTNHPGQIDRALLSLTEGSVERSGSTGSGPLTVSVTQTGFTLPAGSAFLALTGSGTFSAPGSSATLSATVDLGNNEFANNANSSQLFTTGAGTLTYAGSGTGTPLTSDLFSVSGPYSITTSLSINGMNEGDFVHGLTANAAVVAPAPSGLVLAATALPFVGLLRRRLRRAADAPAAPAA